MRCLILPCETRVREFDAKLLLAVNAAARGVGSIVGAKKAIDLDLDTCPPGVYVGKSLTDRSRLSLAMAPLCGHRLAAWDEEGLVWASREVYWRTKVHAANLARPELLIAWGEDNAAAWRAHPGYPGTPIAVAGNPRSDLLSPGLRAYFAEQAAEVARRHGRFVLVNTNFSRVNNLQPRQNRHLKWLRENRPADVRAGFARHKFELFHAFLHMLPELARALPETRFVLRPHPSEDHGVWRALADGLPNLEIDHSGNVIPWLMAADALIHNGCTTAVEAFGLGCPALAWMPVRSADYDHPLPNGISRRCRGLDELIAEVARCRADRAGAFAGQADAEGVKALMARSIAGPPGGACVAILEALAPLLENDAPPAGARPRTGRALLALRRGAHRIRRRTPGSTNYAGYLNRMFPATDTAEAATRVARLAACLGLPRAPRIEELGESVFRIAPLAGSPVQVRAGAERPSARAPAVPA